MGHELLLREEDCSGDLQTGDHFQAKWHFTLQCFCWLCWTFLSHPQVYLAMFHCWKHTEHHFTISKPSFCHFLFFFQQTPCITGLLLCSSGNGKKMMEICGISHNSKRNYCSNQIHLFQDLPKPLFQHLFLEHSTRPLIWKLCISLFWKFVYCCVHSPHESTVKCWSLTT